MQSSVVMAENRVNTLMGFRSSATYANHLLPKICVHRLSCGLLIYLPTELLGTVLASLEVGWLKMQYSDKQRLQLMTSNAQSAKVTRELPMLAGEASF